MVLGNGDIIIKHEGDVTSFEDHGVKAYIQGNGNTTIKTTGDIQAQNMGIQAQTNGTGDTSIKHRGDVTSTDDIGIYALTGGNIAIDVEGEVKARNIGIYARSTASNSAVTVKSRGDVTSETNNAIMAEAQGEDRLLASILKAISSLGRYQPRHQRHRRWRRRCHQQGRCNVDQRDECGRGHLCLQPGPGPARSSRKAISLPATREYSPLVVPELRLIQPAM